MLSHLLNFLSFMAKFSNIGRISRDTEDVNLKSKQEINTSSPPFTTILSLKNPYNKVGVIEQIILSPGNVFIITSYFLNQILASNHKSSMFLNITKTVIEVSCTLIIPKSPVYYSCSFFHPTDAIEYVLCSRHYSRIWGFEMGKKHMSPPPSILQNRLVAEMTINQIFIANDKHQKGKNIQALP